MAAIFSVSQITTSFNKHTSLLSIMMFRSALLATVFCGVASAFAPINAGRQSTSRLNLAVGETAPTFSLQDQNGKTFNSKTNKPLVVYFYPADSTPGCTVQAKAFNEEVKSLKQQYGADVVGISGQDVESKQTFAQELGLDFKILADEGDEIRKAFNVPKAAFGLLPGRVTYVLDKKGECVAVYDNLTNSASHVTAAKDALEEIAAAAPSNKMLSFFN